MRRVMWGVIGAGGIADRRTIPGMMLAKNAELVAVMEVNMEFAERLRAKYNAKRAYDNEDELIADPEVEAIYIASPVIFHKGQVIKAARAGKHVLVEKPVALTCADGEEVDRVCREQKLLAASGFMMRFHAYHQKMKEVVSEGRLGRIVSCRAQITCWYPEIPGSWRQAKSQSGGGALMDMGIHCIDLIQYITGEKAKKVAGLIGTKSFNYDVEDSASVILELTNGAYCYVDANFNIPDDASRCRLEIYGTKGSVLAEGTIGQSEGGKVQMALSSDSCDYDAMQGKVEVIPLDIKAQFGNMYTKEIESFGESILNGCPVDVPIYDAIQVQRIVEAAYKSAASQKIIAL